MASLAAIFAIGKPVALDASAEVRDTRGFISITIIRPSAGLIANWMLQPPVATPTARRIFSPRSRIAWYSRSVRVIAGATVTESPVCTPIGSTFSIEQTTTALSLPSRISSSSNSFQPNTLSSMSTSCTGDAARPAPAIRSSSSTVWAIPEPRPPMVNDGRITTGSPRSATVSLTCSMVWQTADRGTSPPTERTMSLKICRSSPRLMAGMSAPISSTSYRSRVPRSASAMAVFNAVCPPRVASNASIGKPAAAWSAMTCSTKAGVIGSM